MSLCSFFGCFLSQSEQTDKRSQSEGNSHELHARQPATPHAHAPQPSIRPPASNGPHTDEIEAAIEAATLQVKSSLAAEKSQRRTDHEAIVLTGADFNHMHQQFERERNCASPEAIQLETQELWSKRLEGDGTTCPERLLAGLSHVTSIGAGGYGAVFHAKWCHAKIAVKIIVSRPGVEDVSRIEAVLCEGLRHPNVIHTYQTRRAVLTREWLEEAMEQHNPLLASMLSSRSLGQGLLPISTQIQDSIDEAIIATMMQAYESKDGFGTPDGDLPLESSLSIRDILVKCKATEGATMTVILMELAPIGSLDQAMKMDLFDLNKTVRVADPSSSSSRPTATRKSRQVYRAILRTLKEIAQGLAVIHEMEIVHCDLKPSNILLKAVHPDWRGFNAAICDFGLSRLAPINEESAKKQKACGTLIYMSPERLNGTAVKSSDIYSLGVILYQLVSNTEPFKDIPSDVIIAAVKAGKLKPNWPDGVFPELQHLYEQCVKFDPLARPSASDVVRELTMIEIQLRAQMAAADPSMDGEVRERVMACVAALKRQGSTRGPRGSMGPVSHPTVQLLKAASHHAGALPRPGSLE